jgi:hypothetical protein
VDQADLVAHWALRLRRVIVVLHEVEAVKVGPAW